MAFATAEDVQTRLGRTLTEPQAAQAALLLDLATSAVAGAVDQDDDWASALDPVPGMLRIVAIEATCRAMANPDGVASIQEQLGATSYSLRFRDDGGGITLTEREERLVRKAVYGSLSGSSRPASTIDELHDFAYGS